MTDQELAGKVLEALGWDIDFDDPDAPSGVSIGPGPNGEDPADFPNLLTWEGFGYVVEEMEKRGWWVVVLEEHFSFQCRTPERDAASRLAKPSEIPISALRAAARALGVED